MSRRTLHFITLFVLLAMVAPLLGGCAQSEATPSATEAATEAAPSSSSPIVIVDDTGHEETFETPPQRIVVAGRATFIVANTLLTFPEGRDRLVTGESRGVQSMEFYKLIAPNLDPDKFLKMDAGPEQIAAFDPDVVLMKSYVAEKLGPPLEELGIPYVALNLETPEQFYADVRLLGKLLGNEARAEEIVAFYQNKLAELEQRRADVGEKPRVLVVSYSDKGGEVAFKVPPAGWIQTTETVMAGGDPVWAADVQGGGWNVVNFEQIAAWQPEIVFVIAYNQDTAEIAAKLRADENWASLPAGKNGAIYGFPADYYSWDAPDPHWLLGVLWMSKKIHPDAYGDLDLMAELHDFYRTLYGFTDAQIDEMIVPRLSGDVQ